MKRKLALIRALGLFSVPAVLGLGVLEGLQLYHYSRDTVLAMWLVTGAISNTCIYLALGRWNLEKRSAIWLPIMAVLWPLYGALYLWQLCVLLESKWTQLSAS